MQCEQTFVFVGDCVPFFKFFFIGERGLVEFCLSKLMYIYPGSLAYM